MLRSRFFEPEAQTQRRLTHLAEGFLVFCLNQTSTVSAFAQEALLKGHRKMSQFEALLLHHLDFAHRHQ